MDRAWLERSVLLDAEHERRAGENAPNPELNAGVEVSLLASGRIELEHACEFRLRHRTTECAASQRRASGRRSRPPREDRRSPALGPADARRSRPTDR